MPLSRLLAVFSGLLLVILVYKSIYVISEGERGLLLHWGKIIENKQGEAIVKKPGLYWMVPIINSAKIFDTRLQTFNVNAIKITTRDQFSFMIDYYVKWRIKHLSTYYVQTGGNPSEAIQLIKEKINNIIETNFSNNDFSQMLGNVYEQILPDIVDTANTTAELFGIEIVDVGINNIQLTDETDSIILNLMREQRKRMAMKIKAEGKADADLIQAKAQDDALVIEAKAQADAQKIKSEGEAEAMQMHAQAYNKNPEFYVFYKSLQTYQSAFSDKNNIIILKSTNPIFNYFNTPHGEKLQQKTTKVN